MLFSVTYLIGTTAYVFFFLYVLPEYAIWGFVKASALAIFMIEVVKPAMIAVFLGCVLKSRYGSGLGAHFPHICDFSYRYVFEDAEFTHTHWAKLTRLMSEPPDDPSIIQASSPAPASEERTALRLPAPLDLDDPPSDFGKEVPILEFEKEPEISEGEVVFRALLEADVGYLRRYVMAKLYSPLATCTAQCDGIPVSGFSVTDVKSESRNEMHKLISQISSSFVSYILYERIVLQALR